MPQKAIRYPSHKKAAITRAVNAFNAKNGRGGIAYAIRKFKVSRITLMRWLAGAGGKPSGRRASAKGRNKAAIRKLKKALARNTRLAKKFMRLMDKERRTLLKLMKKL